MSPADIVSGAAWFALIAGAAMLIMRSGASDKASAEQKLRNAASAEGESKLNEAAEVAFLNESAAILPDAERALANLKRKYGWQEILDCAHIGALELRLFRDIEEEGEISLPNLELARSDPETRRLVREARYLAPAPGWPEDVRDLIQQPTVQTLLALQARGLLMAKPHEKEPTQRYFVELTDAGRNLGRFDNLFRDKDQHPAWPNSRPSQIVQGQVARIVDLALRSNAKSAA